VIDVSVKRNLSRYYFRIYKYIHFKDIIKMLKNRNW